MNNLAKRDKKIQQLESHIFELKKLLKNNSKEIHEKEKSNKYLTNVKGQFKEYDDALDNLKQKQLNYFNTLKLYLQTLEQEEQIQQDLDEIENEMSKIR